LLLACSQAGCGGGSASPEVLRESETLVHLPRGTVVSPPERAGFSVDSPRGVWLVEPGYLSRIHELLGEAPLPSPPATPPGADATGEGR
jgi:hypothetical protein